MPLTQRPTGRNAHDTKCPDGFTCEGWRRISAGGYVRFQHGRHYHADFARHVGQWVFVVLDDPRGINVDAWLDAPYRGEKVKCANEKDWFADDPEAAARASRRRSDRACN